VPWPRRLDAFVTSRLLAKRRLDAFVTSRLLAKHGWQPKPHAAARFRAAPVFFLLFTGKKCMRGIGGFRKVSRPGGGFLVLEERLRGWPRKQRSTAKRQLYGLNVEFAVPASFGKDARQQGV
jgi:hypothetical protein